MTITLFLKPYLGILALCHSYTNTTLGQYSPVNPHTRLVSKKLVLAFVEMFYTEHVLSLAILISRAFYFLVTLLLLKFLNMMTAS